MSWNWLLEVTRCAMHSTLPEVDTPCRKWDRLLERVACSEHIRGIWGSLQTCYLLPVGKLLNQDRNQWRRITGTWQCAQPGGSTNPLVIQHHKRTVSMGNVSILIKRARRSRVRPYRIIRTAIWLLLTDRSGIQEFGKGIMRQRNPRKVLVHPTE